jgi:glycyl-tRNA synthetase beta subunit
MTPVKKAKHKTNSKGKPSLPVTPSDKRIELLLEIGSEEIPAGMLARAIDELKSILERNLIAENLNQGVTVETFGGPRRLTAWVRGQRSHRAAQVRGLR